MIAALCIVGCSLAVASCSDATDDGPPVLDRIDGPAQVDPSYDPTQVDPTAPPATEAGG